MPSYSGKRTYEMTTKKWNGGRNQRRDERRSSVQNRIGVGARPMVSPWENGVAPGMQSSVLGQGSFSQPFSSSYLLNSGVNRSFGATSYGGGLDYSNKIRHLNRMGAYDDQRGRGLLPNPTPLLGVAPQAFPPPSRGSDFLQQRMGGPWDSSGFHSGGTRGMSSAYYPSNRGRQDNSRRFLKAKRPQNKSSNNSSSSSKGNGPREGRGKAKGANSSNKSPSKGGDDKDKDSSSNTKSGKQGESPLKRERSNKDDADKDMDDTEDEKNEDGVKTKKDNAENEDGEKGDVEKEDKKKDDKQEDTFPVKALYCHICELDSFSSKKGYIRHLQGITHAKMAEVYHAKNAATLELLNISAKLAEMRQRDKVLRRTGKKGQPVMKTTEQILVQKWLKVGSCCGQKYKSPFGLEEHKLSIHHLRAKYMATHKDEEEKPETTTEADEEGKEKEVKEEEKKEKEDQTPEETLHDEVIRLSLLIENAQKESEENPITMNTLPVYNPSTMIGLEYVSKELRFRCKICKGQGFKALESHCQSHSHFDNIASHLNKEEDKKREEKRKQEEAEAAAKKKEEKEAKAKAKAKENEKKEAEIKKIKEEMMEEGDDGDDGGLSSEYITLDDCAKDKSDDEEMDEDVIPLGEEEERILNAIEEDDDDDEVKVKEEEQESQQEDTEAAGSGDPEDGMEAAIFEEIGEKLELENGNKEVEEESQPAEEVEEEPPQKRSAYTPRRRGRARSRTRNNK